MDKNTRRSLPGCPDLSDDDDWRHSIEQSQREGDRHFGIALAPIGALIVGAGWVVHGIVQVGGLAKRSVLKDQNGETGHANSSSNEARAERAS